MREMFRAIAMAFAFGSIAYVTPAGTAVAPTDTIPIVSAVIRSAPVVRENKCEHEDCKVIRVAMLDLNLLSILPQFAELPVVKTLTAATSSDAMDTINFAMGLVSTAMDMAGGGPEVVATPIVDAVKLIFAAISMGQTEKRQLTPCEAGNIASIPYPRCQDTEETIAIAREAWEFAESPFGRELVWMCRDRSTCDRETRLDYDKEYHAAYNRK